MAIPLNIEPNECHPLVRQILQALELNDPGERCELSPRRFEYFATLAGGPYKEDYGFRHHLLLLFMKCELDGRHNFAGQLLSLAKLGMSSREIEHTLELMADDRHPDQFMTASAPAKFEAA